MVDNRKVVVKNGYDDPGDSLNKKIVKATVDVDITSGSGSTQSSHGMNVEPHIVGCESSIDGDCWVSSKGSTNLTVDIANSSAGDGTYTVELTLMRA